MSVARFGVRPADIPGMGLRWDFDDGSGLKLYGFARSERAAMRDMRRRVRRYRKQKDTLAASGVVSEEATKQ